MFINTLININYNYYINLENQDLFTYNLWLFTFTHSIYPGIKFRHYNYNQHYQKAGKIGQNRPKSPENGQNRTLTCINPIFGSRGDQILHKEFLRDED